MNIEALALTGLIALVLLSVSVAVASKMTWVLDVESRVFRAIGRRNDERNASRAEDGS